MSQVSIINDLGRADRRADTDCSQIYFAPRAIEEERNDQARQHQSPGIKKHAKQKSKRKPRKAKIAIGWFLAREPQRHDLKAHERKGERRIGDAPLKEQTPFDVDQAGWMKPQRRRQNLKLRRKRVRGRESVFAQAEDRASCRSPWPIQKIAEYNIKPGAERKRARRDPDQIHGKRAGRYCSRQPHGGYEN